MFTWIKCWIKCWWYGHEADKVVKISNATYKRTCKHCGKSQDEEWSTSSFGEVYRSRWY